MPTKLKSNKNVLTNVKGLDEALDYIKNYLSGCKSSNDPEIVLKALDKELSEVKGQTQKSVEPESNLFKSLTLLEFDNGTLLTTAVPEQYKTFGIDLMRNLQKEHNCQTPSEKATAELVAVNYIRTLEIERRITNYLNLGTFSDMGVRYLAILSKELDRANRHYLTAIQVLRGLKQIPLQFTLKANTAVIGQNQIVQANNHE